MLVLSRRTNDKILFPNLGISVEVLRVKGAVVRLGIKAPDDVKVLRHEVALRPEDASCLSSLESSHGKLTHRLRNRLNTTALALHLMQKQIDAGMLAEAEGTLQRALREFAALDREIGERAAAGNAPAEAASRHALLVEDDTNESELLAGILRMSGFRVDTARDGLAAMGYLNKHQRPDVVLLDMRMPRLDGPKTVSAIRRNPNYSDLKLFAVSAANPVELGVSIGREGVDRWFPKPLNPSALVVEMNRELSSPVDLSPS